MKIVVIQLVVKDNPEFEQFTERWNWNYQENNAGVEHKRIICICGAKAIDPNTVAHYYGGAGFDIGAEQFMAHQIDADLMVMGTARSYFWKPGWLTRIVKAYERYGDALYAGSVSLEACPLGCNDFPNPHIRTAFYAMKPDRFRKYPYLIDNREKGYLFESGEWNIARWFWDSGLPVVQVCWSGFWTQENWAKAPNTFRKGDQSNLLFRDKHTDAWAKLDHRTQAEWRKRAWGV